MPTLCRVIRGCPVSLCSPNPLGHCEQCSEVEDMPLPPRGPETLTNAKGSLHGLQFPTFAKLYLAWGAWNTGVARGVHYVINDGRLEAHEPHICIGGLHICTCIGCPSLPALQSLSLPAATFAQCVRALPRAALALHHILGLATNSMVFLNISLVRKPIPCFPYVSLALIGAETVSLMVPTGSLPPHPRRPAKRVPRPRPRPRRLMTPWGRPSVACRPPAASLEPRPAAAAAADTLSAPATAAAAVGVRPTRFHARAQRTQLRRSPCHRRRPPRQDRTNHSKGPLLEYTPPTPVVHLRLQL